MAKKTNRPQNLTDVPESPDEMQVTKKMLDLGLAGIDSRFTALDSRIMAVDSRVSALESKMDAGFARLEGKIQSLESMVHTVAAETSRTLLLMEQQRSENRMFFEAFGLMKDRQGLLETRVDRIEKKLGM